MPVPAFTRVCTREFGETVLRALIVDDNEDDYEFIVRTLKGAFKGSNVDTYWVQNPDAVNIHQEIHDSDICLIDQNLGGQKGIDLIRTSTENGILTPTILLTGQHSEDIDRLASQSGASDYLVKDQISSTLLNRSIRYAIAQKEHKTKLSEAAYIDGLTGLANRPRFNQALRLAIDSTARSQSHLALFIIDLDDFKIINDTYGHPAGDAVLQEVANRISDVVRRSDIVARLGGDEFAVVLNGYSHEEDIRLIIEKMMAVFDSPVRFGTLIFHFQCSIGIAVLKPGDKKRSADELVRAADGALYKAKQSGKNSFEFFDQHMGEYIDSLAATEADLSNAIGKNELELFFQPKVNAGTMTTSGAEALLRWNRDGPAMGPADFIPIAERSLAILSIGKWVIEQACKHQRELLDRGISVPPVSVNVSPVQVQSESFVEHIKETLAAFDIEPRLIEFEITETVLMEQHKHIIGRIEAVADLGCTWAIDDFGVGYSSLSLLNSIPMSKIKLDKSFVQKMTNCASSRKICSVVTLLAHELELSMVAEGVECQEQVDMLTLMGKDELQGFYYSKPLPFEAYAKLLQEQRIWT